MVAAPTRMASQLARTASTRSKSAALDRASGFDAAPAMYPSIDMAQLSTV
jgi:hypothetical protein